MSSPYYVDWKRFVENVKQDPSLGFIEEEIEEDQELVVPYDEGFWDGSAHLETDVDIAYDRLRDFMPESERASWDQFAEKLFWSFRKSITNDANIFGTSISPESIQLILGLYAKVDISVISAAYNAGECNKHVVGYVNCAEDVMSFIDDCIKFLSQAEAGEGIVVLY